MRSFQLARKRLILNSKPAKTVERDLSEDETYSSDSRNKYSNKLSPIWGVWMDGLWMDELWMEVRECTGMILNSDRYIISPSGGAFPVPPSNPPVQFRTPSPQSQPTKNPLLSPVKGVAQPFAEHKHDDEEIHRLQEFKTQEDFFEFRKTSVQ